MPYGYKGLQQLAAKVQSALGTAHTTMDNSCLLAPYLEDTEVQFRQEPAPIRIANNAFGITTNVYGIAQVDVTVSFPVGVTGSSTEPHISSFLKASGLKLTTSTKEHKYEPSALYSDWTDLTVWGQTGDRESGDGMLTKAANCMFGFVVSAGKVGDVPKITFKGVGTPVALPAAASYITGAQTMPGDTYLPLMSAGTVSLAGQTYKLMGFEFTWATNPLIIPDAGQTFGSYRATIGNDPRASLKLTVLQENFSALTPYALSKTAGTLDIVYGATTDAKVSIVSGASKFIYDPPVHTDSDGIQTMDITGYFIDNDFDFIINHA